MSDRALYKTAIHNAAAQSGKNAGKQDKSVCRPKPVSLVRQKLKSVTREKEALRRALESVEHINKVLNNQLKKCEESRKLLQQQLKKN